MICRYVLLSASRVSPLVLSNGRPFSTDYLESGSVYVHWPYCVRKCNYCDFNKYRAVNVDNHGLTRRLARELSTALSWSAVRRIRSVFLGGGTPSLAPASTVSELLKCIEDRLCDGAEVTLEVNPTPHAINKLDDFALAGVNRLSIGVQTFDDSRLKWMLRDHSSRDARQCLEAASRRFKSSSGDIMFGLPGQTLEQVERDLESILTCGVSHVSLYQLTVKRGTPLFDEVRSGQVTLPSEDLLTDMYLSCVLRLEEAGLKRYEVSNFARPGHESVHNRLVWHGGQYIGVGPGAHSRLVMDPAAASRLDEAPFSPKDSPCRVALVQTPDPRGWSSLVDRLGHGVCICRRQSLLDLLSELLYTSLRTSAGFCEISWKQLAPQLIWPLPSLSPADEQLNILQERGVCHVVEDGRRIVASDRGLLTLDSWAPDLLNWLEAFLQRETRDEDDRGSEWQGQGCGVYRERV